MVAVGPPERTGRLKDWEDNTTPNEQLQKVKGEVYES